MGGSAQLARVLDHVLLSARSATVATHAVVASALKAAVQILQATGGRVVALLGGPWVGEGASSLHESAKLYGTVDELSLWARGAAAT